MLLDALGDFTHMTTAEKQVAEYLLAHPDAINHKTVNEIGAAALTSKPTVLRLCKKLGFVGFKDFRQRLMMEQVEQHQVQEQLHARSINADTKVEELPQSVASIYSSAYAKTLQLLNPQALQRAVNVLTQASTVDFYASGIAATCAESGAFKFRNIGVSASVQSNINEHYVAATRNQVHRVAILVSFTGENPFIVEAASYLKQAGIYLIGIGGRVSNQLQQLTDAFLEVPSLSTPLNMEVVESAAAVNYVIDILFSALTVAKYPQVLKTSVSLSERRKQNYDHHLG